jgi:glycosyltransferase involved in cell wall biosynthesis
VGRFKLEWMAQPWDEVAQAGAWLLQLHGRLHPDVVHLNSFSHAALPFGVPVLVVGHSCRLSWQAAVQGRAQAGPGDPYFQAVARGLAAASAVTAPSQAMLAALQQHYGRFAAVAPIYNGREPADFPPRPKKPFILTAGRLWDEAKNVAALSRVAHRLSWPVFVAGEARHPDGGQLRLQAVRCLGVLPERLLARWMGHAGLFVAPARYEPFGLSVLEAALAGCPLVLGDIPSLRELWEGVALFVPPDDDAALVAAVEELIGHPERRQTLSRRGRQRALGLTPRRMARRYYTLYTELLQAASGPRERFKEAPA